MSLKKIFGFGIVALAVALMFGAPQAHAANTISSSRYLDGNGNGTVETIRWTMDENVTACAYEAGDWAVSAAGTIGVTAVTGISCTGSDAILNITVTSGSNKTGGVTNPTITYTQAAGTADSVTLTSGAMTNKSSASTDGAGPVILSGTYTDSNNDGTVDHIVYTTTADTGMVCTAYTGNTDMTVNTAGTVVIARNASDSCATNGTSTFTITLATVGAANTTGGATAPVVTYTQPGNGLEDGAGNDVPTKSSLTLTDAAQPIVVSVSPANAAVNTTNTADIIITYSEPMNTGSVTFATSPTGDSYSSAWSVGNSVLNLSHARYISSGHIYTATISAAADTTGNNLYGLSYSWTFTPHGGATRVVTSTDTTSGTTTDTSSSTSTTTDTTSPSTTPTLTVTQIPLSDVPATPAPAPTPAAPLFMKNLVLGAKGDAVSALQAFLVKNGFLTMPAGASMGYYGLLTAKAVGAFQVKYNIAASGKAGFMMFGPKTRAQMNMLSGSM